MKCPLFVMGNIANPGVLDDEGEDCFKEECAWYRQQAEHCVMFVLAEDIRDLRDTMRVIRDTMPVVRA